MAKPFKLRPRLIFSRKRLEASSPASPLRDWVRGETELCDIKLIQNDDVNLDMAFVRIEAVYKIHKSWKTPHQSLDQGKDAALAFVEACLDTIGVASIPEAKILNAGQVKQLRDARLDKQVPPLCEPLYFFGVFRDPPQFSLPAGIPVAVPVGQYDPDVWAAYVGKKTSLTHRFEKGHAAFGMLHGPEYEGTRKYHFMARPFFLTKRGKLEVPVEWLPENAAAIVQDIERQLIFELPKTANHDHKDHNVPQPRNILITNLIPGYREFLHGWMSIHRIPAESAAAALAAAEPPAPAPKAAPANTALA